LLDGQVDARGVDTRQIEMNDQRVALPVRVHRHRRGAHQAPRLLGEAVELTERIEPHQHANDLLVACGVEVLLGEMLPDADKLTQPDSDLFPARKAMGNVSMAVGVDPRWSAERPSSSTSASASRPGRCGTARALPAG